MKRTITLLAFFIANLSELRAEASRYMPVWASIAPKSVISQAVKKYALDGAVAGLQPCYKFVIAAGIYRVERMWDLGVDGTRAR